GRSQLYHNNGNGTFTDVTRQALGRTSWGAIGSKAFDFDNDGRLDLLIVDMHSDMWMPLEALDAMWPFITRNADKKFQYVTGGGNQFNRAAAERLRWRLEDMLQIKNDEVVFGNTLFRNLGGGEFEEVSDEAGMETFWPWGIVTGDFDNDG